MDINSVIGICTFCLILVIMAYFSFKDNISNKKIESNNDLTKLELNKFYCSLDLKKIDNDVNEYIKSSIENYMFESGLSLEDNLYLSDDIIKNIIKEVTYSCIKNMSDVYISYISLLFRVRYDEDGELSIDSISYIRNKVRDQVILMAKNINKQE